VTKGSPAFDSDCFKARLRTRDVGREFEYFESVGSTMDIARERASTGASHGALILAEEQTAGRGRRGRTFYSPACENLYFTLVLRLPLSAHRRLPVMVPLAVARAIRAVGVDARIKWPNDIWIGERKVCGMLIDAELTRDGGLGFPGIGVNVNGDPTDNPELRETATSIAREVGHPIPRETILADICNHLEDILGAVPTAVIEEYRELSCTLGRAVSVAPLGGEPFGATALSISDDGELMVRRGDGLVLAVNAADVSLRPR
jgi:BirA family biotin operon repressor/biotin-[acetyl-CoA-carboxylase] ligase